MSNQYNFSNEKEKNAFIASVKSKTDKGMPLKEALNIPKELLEEIYTTAYNCFASGSYNQAEDLFNYLLLIDPCDERFAMGLAMSYHKQEKYEQAFNFYSYIVLSNPKAYTACFHLADCLMQQNKKTLALYLLGNLTNLIDDQNASEQDKEIGHRADEILHLCVCIDD